MCGNSSPLPPSSTTTGVPAARDHVLVQHQNTQRTVGAGVEYFCEALVFYHFGTVDQLLAEACLDETQRRVESCRKIFDGVTSLRELLDVGRRVHAEELTQGNVSVLAQMLAAAHANEVLREATKESFQLWVAEIEFVLRRILAGSALIRMVRRAHWRSSTGSL